MTDNNEPWLDADAVADALDEMEQDAPPLPNPDWLIMGMM